MDQTQNSTNSFSFDGKKRLKKVKRPIKRILPQQPHLPSSNDDDDMFNIDSILDTTNLPALPNSDAPQKLQEEFDDNSAPRFISDEDLLKGTPTKNNSLSLQDFYNKTVIIAAVCTFFIGILFAKIFLPSAKIVRDGLQGVVVNSEVPKGRARCGIAERTQGCVLYIMNPQRQELVASDFYDLAAQLTGRQRFIIETGNMRYSNKRIKPGEIAQFNIPPLQ